jgi:hypothetical protein
MVKDFGIVVEGAVTLDGVTKYLKQFCQRLEGAKRSA